MKNLLIVLALLMLGTAVRAEIPLGFVEDGLVFAGNGLWRDSAGLYFTRTKVTSTGAGYWSCGAYYPGAATYFWKYVAYNPPHVPPAYVAPVTPAFVPGWQEKVLEVAKARDEYGAYLRALAALGLNGQSGYGTPGYPLPYTPALYSGSGTLAITTAGVQGNSIYSRNDAYGAVDPTVLFQQAARLVQNSQVLTGDAHASFSERVAEVLAGQARAAEIDARGRAAALALQGAVQPVPARTVRQTFTFGPMPGADGVQLQPADRAAAMPAGLGAWQLSAQKCVSCHAGAGGKGGFDVAAYPDMTPAQQAQVLLRLTTADDGKRMPRNGDQPGQPLPAQEIGTWAAIIGRPR